MIDIVWILLILVVCLGVLLLATMDRVNNLEEKLGIEGFTAAGADNAESISNVAKLYDQKNFTVTNLKVTGDLEVVGDTKLKNIQTDNAKIGKWNIRDDRIGIPGIGDMYLANDKWLRLTDPDKTSYAGTDGQAGGFAGSNLWCANGTAWSKRNIVDGVTLDKNPAYGGIFRIMAPLEVDQAMNTGINWNRPGIMAKNLVIPSKDFTWGQYWWQGPGHQTAVNVAKKMGNGSLVIGPSIGHNNPSTADFNNLVSAAKKVGKTGCDVRGMFLSLTNHGNPIACK